ncbi:MAG: hypothetical protein V2A58_10155 [Planctomycetota bacterium]
MFGIAWKDIRERWWVAGALAVVLVGGFVILWSLEGLDRRAIVWVTGFPPYAAALLGAMTFSEERRKHTDRFLADLPMSSARIWVAKAAGSLALAGALALVSGLVFWELGSAGGGLHSRFSFPFLIAFRSCYRFWVMGVFLSVIVERAVAAWIATIVAIVAIVWYPSFAMRGLAHPLSGVLRGVLMEAASAILLAGSLLAYARWRHERPRVWDRVGYAAGGLGLYAICIWIANGLFFIGAAVG